MYDGISSNILTGGSSANPDSICITQPGENMFVNADFLNMHTYKWHPNTDMQPYTCK